MFYVVLATLRYIVHSNLECARIAVESLLARNLLSAVVVDYQKQLIADSPDYENTRGAVVCFYMSLCFELPLYILYFRQCNTQAANQIQTINIGLHK